MRHTFNFSLGLGWLVGLTHRLNMVFRIGAAAASNYFRGRLRDRRPELVRAAVYLGLAAAHGGRLGLLYTVVAITHLVM